MTCDVGFTIGQGVNYRWYKDDYQVHDGTFYTIQNAELSQSGSYQCQPGTGERSDPVRLEVSDAWVILQTPLYVYEGDELKLRCHHYPGYYGGQTIFYKYKRLIRDWRDNEELYIGNVDRTTAGTYTCIKQVHYQLSYHQHADEVFVSVQELFTTPTTRVTANPVFERDNMTLTCSTSLHPSRQNTQLRFAFYREEWIVQKFSSNDTYDVYIVHLQNSGKYSCAVETTDGKVRKKSAEQSIQIEELFSHPEITVTNNLTVEGDPMTLTCNTTLSPYIKTTEVQFAFYRDGQKVQEFNSSNKYEVQSAQEEDSGDYTCEVKTSTTTTMKISNGFIILVQGSNHFSLMTILSISLGMSLLIVIILIFLCIYYQRRSSNNKRQTTGGDNEFSTEAEVNYAVLNITRSQQNNLPGENGSNVVYGVVKSKTKQVKTSQEMPETSTDIYQNISSHR
ncbi:high affinity immunoglobulin gamma Fc receptor I-like [Rhinoderma darwinii]|uniref:high affinity immunoglobulin gamma Fc receptor I-like n=1 Tax=Rhinoderma darwinii TaxID=43563 RepID=UPI003F668CA8